MATVDKKLAKVGNSLQKLAKVGKSEKFTNVEARMLTGLRSKCVKGIKSDFKGMQKCIHCEDNN